MATVEPTRYDVYPTEYDPENVDHLANVRHWTLTLERRAPGKWAVCRSGECMNRRGGWTWESLPSSRTDRFKRAYRFSLDEATKLAVKHVDRLTMSGMTWRDFLERLALGA